MPEDACINYGRGIELSFSDCARLTPGNLERISGDSQTGICSPGNRIYPGFNSIPGELSFLRAESTLHARGLTTRRFAPFSLPSSPLKDGLDCKSRQAYLAPVSPFLPLFLLIEIFAHSSWIRVKLIKSTDIATSRKLRLIYFSPNYSSQHLAREQSFLRILRFLVVLTFLRELFRPFCSSQITFARESQYAKNKNVEEDPERVSNVITFQFANGNCRSGHDGPSHSER